VCRGAGDRDPAPLTWDEGEPWTLWLQVTESPREYTITGSLRRGGERMAVGDPLVLSGGGILVTGSAAARFEHGGAFSWAVALREEAEVKVPRAAGPDLIARLLRVPRLPKLDLPPSLRFEQVPGIPRPHLTLRRSRAALSADQLSAALAFAYEGALVGAVEPASGVLLPEARRFLLRDAAAESAAVQLLRDVGFSDAPGFSDDSVGRFMIAARRMPAAVRALVEAGWHVDAAGQVFRSGTAFRVGIASGIDWFDLRVEAAFGDRRAALPELLEALRRGEATVRLDDGSFGLLPEAWLKQLGMLADLGAVKDGGLRYTRSQAGLLDALLAAQPETTCDEGFAAAREELRRFEGIKPVDEPEGFQGALRPYQRDGLGWLHFLRQFRFGGCLADDMGLGKTVQVLALLESRRERRAAPSLVVVPRSLVFNWMQEAQRFAPRLRVLDHSGAARETSAAAFDGYDVVLTTYGTLRRDVAALCDVPFDYVILDEAQAIKNAATQSAKAVRLLRAEHRLALSGTPVENHVGELWSLFEFLNPGMLGRGTLFRGMDARDPGGESRRAVGRALRPFILRRSKEQVAADLPAKLEQTLYCDLLPRDRRRYDGLRDHYRASVLERVERDGLTRARMHVLEALLRLRQAACHYGLIDKSKTGEPSAKLDVLLPQLQEVIEEGHKALVFSQFTSLLAVVRERLDGLGVRYEYLDGRTRDRQARVDRFQGDPECRLFLVSLKAGGLGLNLTAAEYVFLLDPWWNPAVEAQAVDRAHRIGQTRAVFAFRLIARDTVEEKVLQLQESKRSLARDLISGDDSLVRSLTREDLERLLS
jgi:superfamily II DNA or RNA helicase